MCLPNFVSCVHVRFYFSLPRLIFTLLAARCWPLAFLIVSRLLLIFMFSSLQNSSLLFSITRPSSFSVIHVSGNIKNNVEKEATLLLFFLFKSPGGHAIFFPNKTLSCIWVAIPVDWIFLHWYACGVDGRSGGRCTVTWLPNFLGWVVYHIFLPMVLRCARFARESSAIITKDQSPWSIHLLHKHFTGLDTFRFH